MGKEKIDTTNKTIISKGGKDSLSNEARKNLIEDLQSTPNEEIGAMEKFFDKMKQEKEKKKEGEKKGNSWKGKIKEGLTKLINKKCSLYGLELVQEYGDIGGKHVFKMKDKDGDFRVYWGDKKCGKWHEKIGEIKDIGGKPTFWAKDENGNIRVYWGYKCCRLRFKEIGEIRDIGGKPTFWGIYRTGDYCVIRGDEYCGDFFKEIGEIKDIGGKPVFFGRDRAGKKHKIEGYH